MQLLKLIIKYHPNLAIIPECEYIEKSAKALWFGDNPKKGIGIGAYPKAFLFGTSSKYIVMLENRLS